MKTLMRQKLSPALVFLPMVSPLKLSSSLVACHCFFEKVFALVFEAKLMITCDQARGIFFSSREGVLLLRNTRYPLGSSFIF